MTWSKSKLLIFLFMATSLRLYAAKSPNEQLLKVQAEENKQTIAKMRNKILELEKDLNKKNKEFLALVSFKRELEERYERNKKEIELEQTQIKSYQKHLKQTIAKTVLTKATQTTAVGMLAKQLLLKELRKKLASIGMTENKLDELKKENENVKKSYEEYVANEKDLTALIEELEEKKSEVSQNFLQERDRQVILTSRLENLNKRDTLISSKKSIADLDFVVKPPINSYLTWQKHKNGINFVFNKLESMYSGTDGNVLYSGKLSTYGHIILIGHESGHKVVYLGDFQPIIKKGEIIKIGQKIGRLNLDKKQLGKVYFEIRKDDKIIKNDTIISKLGLKYSSVTTRI